MDLEDWRARIDAIDRQLLDLLNQRAQAAIEVGRAKGALGVPYYAPDREKEILDRLERKNPGPFPTEAVRAIWREIFSASLALEQPLRVAYFGPAATFTHQAARSRFGSSAVFLPCRGIPEVFTEVERDCADYGVVPVENSTEGPVNHTLDRLMDSDLLISGEVLLEIHQHLISRSQDISEVKTIYSHPQALGQCRHWLGEQLPDVPTVEVASTAAAVERAATEPNAAAIASELAAQLYDLPILRRRIEDVSSNMTRFLVISRRPSALTGRDKTSILLSIRDEVGALYRILEPFALNTLNLTKIESRPTKRRPWEYVFFVDFEGHQEDPTVQKVLAELRMRCMFLKVLGSYPQAGP